ncbi:MAG: hypothetical protein ABEJ95_07550 [Candidatus Nanohalobium sp.]
MEITEIDEIRMRIQDGDYTHCDVLEDADGAHLCENVLKTTKSESIEELRSEMERWLENESFDELKDEPLDLAIVVRPRIEDNGEIPDVDNVGKNVIDSLVKPVTSALDDHPEDKEDRYLVNDDSQFVRILMRRMNPLYKKGVITVSVREFDPDKSMKLENPEVV